MQVRTVLIFISLSLTVAGDLIVHRNVPYIDTEQLEIELNIRHQVLSKPYEFTPPTPYKKIGDVSEFDVSNATRFVRYAVASYTKNWNEILNWTCSDCRAPEVQGFMCTHLIHDNKTDTLVYLGINTNHRELVIVWRGTAGELNLLLDLEFWKTTKPLDGIPKAYTATGFYDMYHVAQDRVWNALLTNIAKYKDFEIKIIGHSLGGAISSINAVDFGYNGKLNLSSYTFGSPRSGDKGFTLAYHDYCQQHWRMTHDEDPVPHLPLVMMSFLHVTHEVWQHDVLGKYVICDNPSWETNENKYCANSETLWWFHFNLKDHNYMNLTNTSAVHNYIERLKQYDQIKLKPYLLRNH
ncbi:unnamed protein product [Didymodactylos carnosus]|uniref:Fungal lipase-type domain-containing protein n=1 Tax=Didymodactylos carnosus TaxID=1234261 RepID=A0A814WZZ3_9BILA|nr:unnamed protein product [Didymodactylos carnosus]CAF3971838.1 unnamed protein product [Didymodactylos carnosus]